MALTVDEKKLKATKFPPEFDQSVDKDKVNMEVLKVWITNKIESMVGDDDILVETIVNWVQEHKLVSKTTCTSVSRCLMSLQVRIKNIQISLGGFLEDKGAAAFCKELWNLMLSAQANPAGVPQEMVAAKKAELEAELVQYSHAHCCPDVY